MYLGTWPSEQQLQSQVAGSHRRGLPHIYRQHGLPIFHWGYPRRSQSRVGLGYSGPAGFTQTLKVSLDTVPISKSTTDTLQEREATFPVVLRASPLAVVLARANGARVDRAWIPFANQRVPYPHSLGLELIWSHTKQLRWFSTPPLAYISTKLITNCSTAAGFLWATTGGHEQSWEKWRVRGNPSTVGQDQGSSAELWGRPLNGNSIRGGTERCEQSCGHGQGEMLGLERPRCCRLGQGRWTELGKAGWTSTPQRGLPG